MQEAQALPIFIDNSGERIIIRLECQPYLVEFHGGYIRLICAAHIFCAADLLYPCANFEIGRKQYAIDPLE